MSKFWNQVILKYLLRDEDNEERTYFALTLVVGIIAGCLAVFINKSVHFLVNYFGTHETFTLKSWLWGSFAILVSAYITTRHYQSTSGSGVPGVKVALAVFHGKISIGASLAKLITTILSLSSGISLGREGPTLSICSGIGSGIGRLFHLSKKRIKGLVAVGAAGGIAAAFNTPIAAVVFTLEEVVGDLNAKVLGNIIIASVVSAITAHLLSGNQSAFTELNYSLDHPREIFFYLTVGLSASLLGPFWVKSVLTLRKLSQKVFKRARLTVMFITFIIMGLISYAYPEVLGSGHETIEEALLSLIQDPLLLLLLFVLKFFVTSLCYSSGISGGLFMPTLLLGAALGSLHGAFFHWIFPEITPNAGAYALVGMGAFFVSVIRAPFTSILMIFELTRDYNIILPLMIANIVSFFISGKIGRGSIYEKISEQDGVHMPKRTDNDVLENLLVEDAMVFKPETIAASVSINEARQFVKDKRYSGYPVLENGELKGVVSISDIGAACVKGRGAEPIINIAEKKVISIFPDQSLLVAFHKLNRFHVSRLPVVSRLNHLQIVGILTAENIVSKFGYHIHSDHEEDKRFSEYEQEFLKNQQEKVPKEEEA